jgi:SAM-dependent methyltransferase
MRDFQRQWDDPELVAQFADKTAADFFRSETHFLDRISGDLTSVLDIGCASARFLDLLQSYGATPRYTGLDVSAASLSRARAAYPQAHFLEADALDCVLSESFTLVNATGVLQHEPRFETLIRRMLEWSERYVMFDVKLARIGEHLIDIERAYCGGRWRLHYIVLAPATFLAMLQQLPEIRCLSVFGYPTAPNARTVLPDHIGPIVSAGVLIEKGHVYLPEVSLDLPAFLGA